MLGKLFIKDTDEEESNPPSNLIFIDLDDYILTKYFLAMARLISRVSEITIKHSDRLSDELSGSVATILELYGFLKPELKVGTPSDLHDRPGKVIHFI